MGPKWDIKHHGFLAERAEYNVPQEKIKASNFFITYNTNRLANEVDPKKLEQVLNTILSSELIRKAIYYVDDDGFETNKDFYDQIESANVESVVEIASKTGYVHAHILISFKHRTKLRLDYALLKKLINDAMAEHRMEFVYYHTKLFWDATPNILNYMAKTNFI